MTLYNRRLASATICLALATLTSGCAKPVGSDVQDLLRAGKYKEGLELVKKELEEHPESADLYAYKGHAECFLDQLEQSRDDFRRAIEIDGKIPWYHLELGSVYSKLGKEKEALASYDAVVALDSKGKDASRARTYKSYIYTTNFECEKGLVESDAAIAIDPEYPYAYVERAWARIGLQDLDNAMKDSEKALELDPKCSRALIAKSAVFYRQYDFERSAVWAKKALELEPEDFMALEYLAASYEGMGDTEKAIEILDKLLKKFPDSSQVLADKATVLVRSGRIKEARELADRALSARSDNISARMVNSTLAAMKGDRKTAMDMLDTCAKLHPGNADVDRKRAIALIALKDYEGAIKAADAALVKQPDSSSTYRIRSEAESRLGLRSEAERDLQKALDLKYRRPSPLESLFKLL
ncbi:MAG: tetratricopeptide repeat protein [Candidatus Melainabacteria bacterium]|nr:tetratricopeptide repeat protein [Candidatus Melainabacteria bacterium]